jgi:eukaryotic-like serine/threonine-protein kinase
VAIKLLTDHVDLAGERRARLAREARALARVSHPAIVQIYDIGEVDGSIWVAMELVVVEGQTLRGWLASLEPSGCCSACSSRSVRASSPPTRPG